MTIDADRIEIVPTVPTVPEYQNLMARVGFTVFPDDIARQSLDASVFAVTLRQGGACLGMGRIVGDGICFVEIVDVVVDPAHQRKGHGRQIMAALMDFVQANLPKDAFVNLSAHVPADRLYAQFGFEETAPEAVGMCYRVR
jgi:GNAT superfamily N-acetyltransferase